MEEITSVAARRHFLRGVQHVQSGAPELAITEFSLALKHQENLFAANRARAQAYVAAGRHELALADFTLVMAKAPGASNAARAAVLYERGEAHLRMGSTALASADWQGALQLSRDCVRARQGLEQLALDDAIEEQSDSFDDCARPHASAGQELGLGADQGMAESAEKELDEEDFEELFAASKEGYVRDLRNRAYLAYDAGEYSKSNQLLRRLCAKQGSTAFDWRRYGHSLYTTGDCAGAVSATTEALCLEPMSAWAWNLLGAAHESLGERDLAVPAYCKSLDLDPTSEYAILNLRRVAEFAVESAHTLRQAMNFESAAMLYGALALARPSDGALWFYAGYCHERQQQHDAAIDAYERALSCGAWPAVTLNNLALVLRGLGRNRDANAARDAAAAVEPAIEQALGTQALLPEDLAYLTGIADEFNLDQSGARTTPESQYLRGHALLRAHLNSRGRIDPEIAPFAEAWVVHAIGHFSAAIEHYGNSHAAFTRRGACWLIAGEYKKAAADFTCALDLWPDHELALRWRSVAHRAMKAWGSALSDVNRLFATGTGDCMDRLIRAELLINLGQFRATLDDLGACIDQGYKAELAYTLRATALTHMGWANAALADMHRAMSLVEQRVRRETMAKATEGLSRPPRWSNSNREFDNSQDLEEEGSDLDQTIDSDEDVESFILS